MTCLLRSLTAPGAGDHKGRPYEIATGSGAALAMTEKDMEGAPAERRSLFVGRGEAPE